jgi:hypothetical protein
MDFNGYLKFFAHPKLTSPFAFDRFGARFQLTFKEKRENIGFFASFNFDLDERNISRFLYKDRSSALKIYPVEAYLTIRFPNVDFKLGKQFIFWGRTDWINPTDNITPWDYTNITAEIEDYRIAVNSVKINWYFGISNIEFVFVPYFIPNETGMKIPGAETSLPEQKPENWQEGVRFSSGIAGINFSFSYWRGFDLFPAMVPEKGMMKIEYQKQQVFGFDFDYAIGRFVFKGEGAYFLTEDREGYNPFIKNPHLQYVLGTDYNLTENFILNFQFIENRVLKWREGFMSPVEEKLKNSTSLRIAYKREPFYSLQLIMVYNFKDGDYFILPIFTYEIRDGIKLYMGASIFRGPEDSVFGRNKKLSKAFIEVKYFF